MSTAFLCLDESDEGESCGGEGRTFRLLDARLRGRGLGRQTREGEGEWLVSVGIYSFELETLYGIRRAQHPVCTEQGEVLDDECSWLEGGGISHHWCAVVPGMVVGLVGDTYRSPAGRETEVGS